MILLSLSPCLSLFLSLIHNQEKFHAGSKRCCGVISVTVKEKNCLQSKKCTLLFHSTILSILERFIRSFVFSVLAVNETKQQERLIRGVTHIHAI